MVLARLGLVQYTTQLQENADYIVSVHMREEMEELIYQYQVNLMLVGHQHSYVCMFVSQQFVASF